jgi:PAS domain S-box-containing protein
MQPSSRKTRVLVVEDEIVVSEDLQQRLTGLGFEIAAAADTAAEAIELAGSTQPDVALMDIMLHGRPEGIDAAEHLRFQLDIPVIYLTAHSDSATLRRAKMTDPSGYIVKPFDDAQLRVAIEMAPIRHNLERKTRHAANWLSATLTSIGDAVIATDTEAVVLLLNPAAEKLTGWSQDEAAGRPCADILHLVSQSTGEPIEDPARSALRHGLVIRLEPDTVLITRRGEQRFVDDSASPIADASGKVLGAVVVLVDASERVAVQKHAQAMTRQVADLLAEQERHSLHEAELEAFAAAVSHDLRTPLNSIMGFSELLGAKYRDRLDIKGQLFLDQVRSSAIEMRRMVEDYLHFLKSNHGQTPDCVEVEICPLAHAIFSELTALPGRKPARFVCQALPPAWADEVMLRRLLVNLIDNALKFSHQRGLPVVEVGALPGGDADSAVTYFVRDNGAGFDLASAAKLFEPFQRFHSAADFPGTGVGLAIVKRIAESHGGRVWAESQVGAGATFFFSLPRSPVPEI